MGADEVMRLGPVIAVVVIRDPGHAEPLARALAAGGIKAVEITLRSRAALEAIRRAVDAVPEAVVGAGTVLSPRDPGAADAAFNAFPQLARIASTVRVQSGVDDQQISASLFTRENERRTQVYSLSGVVDRIGGGDAFAAGVLHGLLRGLDDQASLDFALASAALKHSVPGDFNLIEEADVQALLSGGGLDVRR